jgi:S-disulfanyl-L-cysteine oxidoreductase SoxD
MSFKPLIPLSIIGSLFVGSSLADDVETPQLGKPLSRQDVDAISMTIFPNGDGLPKGSGTAKQGKTLYEEQCTSCHGENGVGDMRSHVPALAGEPMYGVFWSTGTSWPYSTSIFDYVRRSMPPHNPKELTADELYSLTAYILQLNKLVSENQKLDENSLAKVKMPSISHFSSKWEKSEKDLPVK